MITAKPSGLTHEETAAVFDGSLTALPFLRDHARLCAGQSIFINRPLLYMHLLKLGEAGFVAGHLGLSPDGKALKVYEVVPFRRKIKPETISGYVDELKE